MNSNKKSIMLVVSGCLLTLASISALSCLATEAGNLETRRAVLEGQSNLLRAYQAETEGEFKEAMKQAIGAQLAASEAAMEARIRDSALKESIPTGNLLGGAVGIIVAAVGASRKLSKSGGKIAELKAEQEELRAEVRRIQG